jgi:amidase
MRIYGLSPVRPDHRIKEPIMNDFAFQSAVELTRAIRDRRISSLELLALYIERVESLNPAINAIVATDFFIDLSDGQ